MLQYFPVPDDPATNKALDAVLKRIITGTGTAMALHHTMGGRACRDVRLESAGYADVRVFAHGAHDGAGGLG